MRVLLSDWRLWALGSAIFAAATALLAKAGVSGLPSNVATFLRTLVIVPMLLLVIAAAGEFATPWRVTGRSALFLVLSGVATGLSWLCYFRALKLGPAARVAPVDKLSVVLTAVLAAALFGERLSPLAWAGVALIALGSLLVALA